MPIRPDLLHHYRGPAYRATRARILARAGNKCEQCGAPNREQVKRGPAGTWRADGAWRTARGSLLGREPRWSERRDVTIVLTLAHLNHTPGDDRESNLKALCQWCHLNYDKLHHKHTRSTRKDGTRPLLAEIERCDREIAEMAKQTDKPAWLVTLGMEDLEMEKRLIQQEMSQKAGA